MTDITKCSYKRNIEARSLKSSNHYVLLVCVCSLSNPACKAHAPFYSNLWPVCIYNIIPHYLINGTIFEKELPDIKYLF